MPLARSECSRTTVTVKSRGFRDESGASPCAITMVRSTGNRQAMSGWADDGARLARGGTCTDQIVAPSAKLWT